MNKKISLFVIALYTTTALFAQSQNDNIKERLNNYFTNYTTDASIGKCKLDYFKLDNNKRTLIIYPNVNFGYQPFTPEKTKAIYDSIRYIMPGPINYYDIKVVTDNRPIEELIPNFLLRNRDKDKSKLLKDLAYSGEPWVKNISRPYEIDKGLDNKHLVIWQSHGKYYKNSTNKWEWQRPLLYGTCEDLFSQSFVVPFLIPMLQNAGANVFTPRERDWQKNEVIVDNDGRKTYYEKGSGRSKWSTSPLPGFAFLTRTIVGTINPFKGGTARIIRTEKKSDKAFAQWIPTIPATGKYAVYVSYQSLPESVNDANYMVFHKGGVTKFTVNQQMGGGTWVYLGTFEFDKGFNDYGMVVLSNESKHRGIVCADAVRFGGGMGNIERGSSVSGLPRYLEGARYTAQWYGMPDSVYSASKGTNDYNDDINSRGKAVNYLNGGSVYNKNEKGLKIPVELCMGLHTDAGCTNKDSIVGTLGIFTTDFNDGKLKSGLSRYASRDLTDMVISTIKSDITKTYNIPWTRRSMWNRSYSESRLPDVPSMILEMMSHQNFTDMKLGHDPNFKFLISRSIYKSILKYVSEMHGNDYVVQPLPVNNFSIQMDEKQKMFNLSWLPVTDRLEPSARAHKYIVYTRIGDGGFDNGVLVKSNQYTFEAEPGIIYSFKVTAVNDGGESFPSEILSAYISPHSKGTALIINSFDRLSGPEIIDKDSLCGFNINSDIGIPYIATPEYCGAQISFNKNKIGTGKNDELGASGRELEGKLIAGNTFDYVHIHGKAIKMVGGYSFVSSSNEAVQNRLVNINNYKVVDLIMGSEKREYTITMQSALRQYCNNGGNLFVSGSYIASSVYTPSGISFMRDVLKCRFGGNMRWFSSGNIYGAGRNFNFANTINEDTYAVQSPDCILPQAPAFSSFVFTPGNYGAGISYRGKYRTFVMGIPFESIIGNDQRIVVMSAILNFFNAR